MNVCVCCMFYFCLSLIVICITEFMSRGAVVKSVEHISTIALVTI